MDELRTVYMIGNHDSPETFLEAEKELISRGYKPLNPVKMLMPGWTVSAEAATEQEVAAFCGKRQVRIF